MEIDKSRPYGTFYLVRSASAGDMYYRDVNEARKFGLPTEVAGYPVCAKADRLCKNPIALYGSEAERDAAHPTADYGPLNLSSRNTPKPHKSRKRNPPKSAH